DKGLSEELYFSRKNKTNSYFTPNIKNGVELKSYLEYIDFTLSGRMHFGISGYSLKKPMLGITYEDKFSGLQRLFGLNPEFTLIADYKNISQGKYVMDYFLENLDNIQKNIDSNYAKVI